MANHSSLRKWGLKPRKGVEHYSAQESNIYWVRVLGMAGRMNPESRFSPIMLMGAQCNTCPGTGMHPWPKWKAPGVRSCGRPQPMYRKQDKFSALLACRHFSFLPTICG